MTRPKIILIIDDDADIRGALSEQLVQSEGFAALEASSAAEGLQLASAHHPDLILLDLDLPDMNGRETCQQLRASGISTPVIMLTAASGDADTILGLEAGANDYVAKPFKFSVLLARIRAQLRSYELSEDAVIRLGQYEFQSTNKTMSTPGGRKIRLTDKEAAILKYLYRAGDKSVSRDELLAEVWGYNSGVTTHTLETHIYRLRQKIETGTEADRLILTEPGGYRLRA